MGIEHGGLRRCAIAAATIGVMMKTWRRLAFTRRRTATRLATTAEILPRYLRRYRRHIMICVACQAATLPGMLAALCLEPVKHLAIFNEYIIERKRNFSLYDEFRY